MENNHFYMFQDQSKGLDLLEISHWDIAQNDIPKNRYLRLKMKNGDLVTAKDEDQKFILKWLVRQDIENEE